MTQTALDDHVDLTPDDERPDCRRDLAHLQYVNEDTGETAAYRCGDWRCKCCGYRMKRNLLEGLDDLIADRPEMSRFLTLTVDPAAYPDAEAAHEDLGACWNRLRSYLRSAHGDFSFVWVREEQENGYPHLHIIVSRYLPWGDIQAAWKRTGAGEVVDIQKVEARSAGKYLAKYLAKDAMANIPGGVHRYGTSADIDLGVRGGGSDEDTPWFLGTEDPVTGVMVEADSLDFVRREPPPGG